MWSPLLKAGGFSLVAGRREILRPFHQELAYDALHERPGTVLWCDGNHGFNPYEFAELNLIRGFDADWGAERLLVKRCMTPFQWDTVLTKHVEAKLKTTASSLVLAAPFDDLFSTDELQPWEQEGYVRYASNYLRGLAKSTGVPIVVSVDISRWRRSHPQLAHLLLRAVRERWVIQRRGGGWLAESDRGDSIATAPVRHASLGDFATAKLAPDDPNPAPRRPARRVASLREYAEPSLPRPYAQ
ncbi:MAG: P-loop NTPase family protein [Thermoplasmatota archaeon]